MLPMVYPHNTCHSPLISSSVSYPSCLPLFHQLRLHLLTSLLVPPKNKNSPSETDKSVPAKPAKTATSGSRTVRVFFFIMKDGSTQVFFKKAEADTFRIDFSPLIVKEHKFMKLDRYRKFKATLTTVGSTTNVASAPAGSPSDRLIKRLAQHMPDSDRIEAHVKTTDISDKLGIVLRFINMFDSDAWCVKPAVLVPVMKAFGEEVAITDPILKEFLMNLDYSPASDPHSSDKNKKLITTFTPKNEPKASPHNIDEYRAHSIVTIPVDALETKDQETEWIKDNIRALLMKIREVMMDETFKDGCFSMPRYANIVHRCYDPSKKTNLPQFLSGAGFKVVFAANFADHIIQHSSNIIMETLYNYRRPAIKYMAPTNEDALQDTDDEALHE